MRKPYLLISAAWLLHAVAWFLPVVKDELTFPHGLPGWQAFRVAASAVWPYEGIQFNAWYNAVLSTISAVTTPLFILGSVWVVLRGTREMRRASAWVATFAFIVNAHWYVLFGSDRKDFRIGYFLWWLSFLLVALGLFALSHQTTDNAPRPFAKLQVPDSSGGLNGSTQHLGRTQLALRTKVRSLAQVKTARTLPWLGF